MYLSRKTQEDLLTTTDFNKFRRYIEDHTGISLDENKQNTLKTCLDARMDIFNIRDYDSYYSLIASDEGEKEFCELLNLLLVKETFFFRDKGQLNILTKKIVPELLKKKKGEEIKIWSAGCATGEEPYSIAMSIMENFTNGSLNFSIIATDISAESLELAGKGIYKKTSMRSIDELLLNKYFSQKEGLYYLHEQIKQLVRFDVMNLVKPCFPSGKNVFDIIFCKNVIIYFGLEKTKTVIQKFYDMLTEEGVLFIGYSESLWRISDKFKLEEADGVFFYRKAGNESTVSLEKKLQQKAPEEKTILRLQSISPRNNTHTQQRVDLCIASETQTAGSNGSGVNTKQVHGRNLSHRIKQELKLTGNFGYEDKLEHIDKILQTDPKNEEVHLFLAKIYANRGVYEKALQKCQDVLVEMNDLSAEAYLLTGSVFYKTGDRERAVWSLKRAIYLDERSALSHYYLGNLYKDSGLIGMAIKEYKQVIHIFDASAENDEQLIDEVFTVRQLKELCMKNIELLKEYKKN
ncbi:MAG: CheR family methyltransferase [Candidatus Loosdrechtia sp.]|uniref:CheR family methyltransferase n=1 Tax=Candidatus Loosdrechtia sp. TaxID=3101272 RepID=UPI003A6C3256|nr:MAG: CheR family methyltransferase [Candidatus Jettenia sp. AMX2]